MTDVDVIVLGSGFAGLRAAVAASATGASVLVVEAQGELGGRSRYSWANIMGAGTRFQVEQGIQDSAEAMYEQYMRLNAFRLDASVAWALCSGTGPEIEWLADNGAEIRGVVPNESFEVPRIHRTGGGQQLIDLLLRLARAQGVDFALHHRVDRLLIDGGQVTGIEAAGQTLTAKAVVLATGGMGGNTELIREWMPELAALAGDWVLPVGGDELAPYAQGDAVPLSSAVGAQITGRNYYEATIRPGYVQVSNPALPGHLLMVDATGRRFVDETAGIAAMHGAFNAAVAPVYAIFDEDAKTSYKPTGEKTPEGKPIRRLHPDWVEDVVDSMVENQHFVKAQSLKELSELLGIPSNHLIATIDQYNTDTALGFDSVQMKEAKVMRVVSSGPFYATEIRLSSIGFTGAGPRVNAQGAVLDTKHQVIPGLFAGGECAGGLAGPMSIGGNPTATCFVFGRIAGESAAAFAQQ